MAYVTITNTEDGFMTLQERLSPSDMESEFFCAHLLERLRWAVQAAHVSPSVSLSHGDARGSPVRQRLPEAGSAAHRLPLTAHASARSQ